MRIQFGALLLLGLPGLLHTQQPTHGDSLHTDVRVFADILAGQSFADIVLGGHISYRLEIRPVGSSLPSINISLRAFPANGLPPLVESPLADPNIVTGGVGFIIRPQATGVYRMTVAADGQVDVRIIRDARETERMGRIEAGIASPTTLAGISLRAVWMGAFSKPNPGVFPSSAIGAEAAAVAPEMCIDIAPHLPLVGDRIRGCAVIFTWYQRSNTAPILAIGTSPHFILSGMRGWTRTYAVLTLAFAGPTGSNSGSEYTMVGPGLGIDHQFGPHIRAEAEAGVMIMHTIGTSHTGAPPRIAAGLQYLF